MNAMELLKFFILLSAFFFSEKEVHSAFIADNSEGLLMAVGDFNNDKYIDLVVANNELKAFAIWYYNKKSGDGDKLDKGKNNVVTKKDGQMIASVVPGDFNADSTLDVAVFMFDGNEGNNLQLMMFYHDSSDSKLLQAKSEKEVVFKGQPLVADVNGDQIPDFIGNIDGVAKIVHTTNVTTADGQSRKEFSPYELKDQSTNGNAGKLNENCGHSFAQLASDAQPDLLLVMDDNKLQVWKGDKGRYSRTKTIDPPRDMGQRGIMGTPIVFDINLDGKNDIVLPICTEDCNGQSFIYYYECEKDDSSETVADTAWNLLHSFQGESTSYKSVTEKNFIAKGKGPLTNSVILRVGDVDFDGYPDLLAIMKKAGSSDTTDSQELYLLQNGKCGGNKNICDGSRGLSAKELGEKGVETATFFDYKEDGGNNLIFSKVKDGKYYLGYKDISDKGDSSFLKVMVIGGHCGPGGSGDEKCKFGESVNYGANLPGPTIEYETHGSSGDKRVSIGNQLSQSAHQALQSPSYIFGLGHTPNFVEKLTITLASQGNKIGQASMENVIPNSQIILIPYPPDKPSKWTFQLLLTPSDIIWKFAVALFSVVVVLAIVVALLQYQEKREDDAEKREEAHKFHFDAM